MSKGFKFLFLGIIICIVAGSFVGVFLVDRLANTKMEPTQSDELSNFTSIDVDLKTMDLEIKKSNQNRISYVLQDSQKQKLEYQVKNKTLTIQESTSKNFSATNKKNKIIIYTNQKQISLQGNCRVSDVELNNLHFNSLDLNTTSGDIDLNDVKISTGQINATSGDIDFEGKTEIDNKIDVTCTSGDVDVEYVKNVLCKANATSGDIEIAGQDYENEGQKIIGRDSAALNIKTTSGDISVN